MGLMDSLTDFGGGFFQNQALQAGERRQISVREALEAKREAKRLADEQRRRQQGMEDAVVMRNLDSQPRVGLDKTGKQALMLDSFAMQNGVPARETTVIGDAPRTKVGRPYQVYDGPNRVSMQDYSDGTSAALGAPSPVRQAGEGRAPPRAAFKDFKRPDGSVEQWRIDPITGDKLEKVGESGPSSDKPPTAASLREAENNYQSNLIRAGKASKEDLLSMGTALGLKESELISGPTTAVGANQDYTTEIMRANVVKAIEGKLGPKNGGAQSGAGAEKGKGTSQQNPADAKSFKGDPPSGTWVRLPSGKVIQVP